MTESHQTQPAPATARIGDDLEVVVVGGGQAGLAVGYFLAQQGRNFAILEAAEKPASAWHARWDSLKLFTPARYSSLPGLPYARAFSLPVVLGSRVRSVRPAGIGTASSSRTAPTPPARS